MDYINQSNHPVIEYIENSSRTNLSPSKNKIIKEISSLNNNMKSNLNIIQGATIDARDNSLYVLKIWKSDKKNEQTLIEKYSNNNQFIYSTKPSNILGHQTIALTYSDKKTYIWGTAGSSKDGQRALFISRIEIDPNSGEISNPSFFKIFDQKIHVNDANRVMAISPDFQYLVALNAIKSGNIWIIRVFPTNIFKSENTDYSNNYLYQFPIQKHNLPLQSICTDGKFIYILHGGSWSQKSVIDIYSLQGNLIKSYSNNLTGKDYAIKMNSLYNLKYYEPEVLFLNPNKPYSQNSLNIISAIPNENPSIKYTNIVTPFSLNED